MTEADQPLLLLITDDPAQCRVISALAGREGWLTSLARDRQSALDSLKSPQGKETTAIILDQAVARDEACGLVAELRSLRPNAPILMLTASTSPQLAVEAMRAGATDFLVKPLTGDRLIEALRLAGMRGAPAPELQPLAEKLGDRPDFDAMVGAAPAFRTALAVAAKAARAQTHIIVEGESGTGKEMLVRAIHAASPRAKAPLTIVNAGGIPANQIESTLFGHEKGAFPGAFDRHVGAIQNADGGTLVIDEIDRLPGHVQERLAQSIARGDVRPIGARHSFRVDVRFIVASNTSLRELATADLFRKDLLEALAAIHVHLPPLRERSGDIAALVRHFLARIGEQPGLRHLGVTDSALALLSAYDWPGNVRQLQATLFRACVFCDRDALTPADFPNLSTMIGDGASAQPSQPQSAGIVLYAPDGNLRPLEEIEADVIRLAIGHYRGRMTEVARRLGIGRSTLYRKLGELGIENAA